MGNTSGKHQIRDRPRKNVHWKSAEPPVAPGKPTLVPGDADTAPDVVTIRWEKPLTDGGAPVLGYLVEHRRTGSPHWVRATPGLVPYTELTLSGLEPGWRYQFRVAAENIVGLSPPSELSDGLTVTLQRTAISVPRFVKELDDCTTIENDRIEFHVQVTGTPPPEVNWFKDGFEIFSSRRIKILTENDTSLLVIHQASLTDEGEIKCTATNRAGHVVTRCRLSVEAPPKIRLPRQYEDGLLIEADEVIRLKVGVAGRPAPTVAWLQNGEMLRADDRHEIITTDRNSSLKITNARRSDRGEYNVRATNKLGEDNAPFLVTVTSRPSSPGKVLISMSIGKSVSLTWTSPDDDGGCKIGNYVVEYFRLGWNVWLKATTTRQLSTTLNDLIEGSEYKFRVKAENPYGMSEPSEESDVLFIPDPKRGITKPNNSSSDTSVFIDDQRPTIVPRRKHTTTPPTPSSQSLDSNINQLTRMVDKSEQTHVARLKITRPTVNIQLIPQVFDSETIAQDISYGTPDPMIKRDKSPLKQKDRSPSDVRKDSPEVTTSTDGIIKENTPPILPEKKPSVTLSERSTVRTQMAPKISPTRMVTTTIQEPSPEKHVDPVRNDDTTITSSPETDLKKPWKSLTAPRENNDGIHSSGEFVLVLYDDKDPSKRTSKQQSFDFEIDEPIPPPPLSLSAPELTAEIPPPPTLRRAVSSTELLYERAMARFYSAVEAEEEAEKNKKRAQTPQLTKTPSLTRRESFNENDRNERRSSLRRRLSGEIQNAPVLTFKRTEPNTVSTVEDDIVPKKEKTKSGKKSNESLELKKERDDLEYTDDYTDSTVSSDESETEKFKRKVREHAGMFPGDDELETYHPTGAQIRVVTPYSQPAPDQAAEVLSKPFNLPSPDFVPKPILKRRTSLEPDLSSKEDEDKKRNQKSPEKTTLSKLFDLKPLIKGSNSKIDGTKESESTEKVQQKPLSASELAKKKKLEERQASLEEEKVVIDHYSDIVREMGSGRKSTVPLYLSADQLKIAAEKDNEEEVEAPVPKPIEVKQPIVAAKKVPSRSNSATRKPTEVVPSEKAQKEVNSRGRSPAPKTGGVKPRSRDVSNSSQSGAPRRTVQSAVEKRAASKTRNRSESKSPATLSRRPLAQKSVAPPAPPAPPSKTKEPKETTPPSPQRSQTPTEVISQEDADIKVKSTFAYITDLALFVAACWLYFFKDARLVIPLLALMVYRQIGDAVRAHLPAWMRKKDS
ncbi:muscle M-line assembly protein unc-89 [Sergentomyia squamirostris]